MKEMRNPSEAVEFASKQFSGDRVLDLTDPGVLKHLGINDLSSINSRLERLASAYDIPQAIGNIAAQMGFDAILYESARHPGSTCIVTLKAI